MSVYKAFWIFIEGILDIKLASVSFSLGLVKCGEKKRKGGAGSGNHIRMNKDINYWPHLKLCNILVSFKNVNISTLIIAYLM